MPLPVPVRKIKLEDTRSAKSLFKEGILTFLDNNALISEIETSTLRSRISKISFYLKVTFFM